MVQKIKALVKLGQVVQKVIWFSRRANITNTNIYEISSGIAEE